MLKRESCIPIGINNATIVMEMKYDPYVAPNVVSEEIFYMDTARPFDIPDETTPRTVGCDARGDSSVEMGYCETAVLLAMLIWRLVLP